MLTNAEVQKISDKGVTFAQTVTMDSTENQDVYCKGRSRTLPCDTAILAVGQKPIDEPYRSLKGRVKELYRIGDSQAAGKIHDAVWDGFELGRNL